MPKPHNIFVTRELTDPQLEKADSLGLDVIVSPAISIRYRDNWLSVQTMIDAFEKVIFLFTSQNGVYGFNRFKQAGVNFPEDPTIYAVGGKTAEALSELGYNATVPDRQDGFGLAEKIIDDYRSRPELKDAVALHFCGNRRRDELRQFLTESDITVKDIVVYETELNEMELPASKPDGILFYSPSAVQAYRNSGGFRNKDLPELFAIGNTTAEELSIETGRHVHVSPEPDTEVFLAFVSRILSQNKISPSANMGKAPKVQRDDSNLYYNKRLKELARKLRNNSTKSEIRLWSEFLRGKKTGHTFLRQRPVINYIADFFCKDLKLIIELDGYSHDFEQQWKKDEERQKELEEAGFKILRFTDDEVMNDLRNVESEIMYWLDKLETIKKQDPSPPSKGAGR